MLPAIFLDRDGVINQERKDYVKNLNEFKIFSGVAEAIDLLRKKNFLIIIITNQSVINRKLLDVNTLETIHEHFQKYLKKIEKSEIFKNFEIFRDEKQSETAHNTSKHHTDQHNRPKSKN